MWLSAAACGVVGLLLLLNLVRVAWWRSEYGWFQQVAMVDVLLIFVAIRAGYSDWPYADLLMVVGMAAVVPLAAWRLRLASIPPPPDDDPPSP